MWLRVVLLLALGFYSGCSPGRELPKEFIERSVVVDGKNYRFRVLVPKGRSISDRLPVMLYLHGSGSRGNDNKQPALNFSESLGPIREKIDFIVVFPQCSDGNFWASTEMASYAMAAFEQSVEEFNGDESKLYLAGFSLGGYGAIHLAAAFPGKFSAIVPIAGGVVGERPILPEHRKMVLPQIEKMLDSADPYISVAEAIGQTPAWVFHGAKDESVPVEFSRKFVEAMKAKGNMKVRYTEYETEGHLIESRAFSEPELMEWLSIQMK